MAGEAAPDPKSELERLDRDILREACAKLYGRGFSRPQIARQMAQYLIPTADGMAEEYRLKRARMKLKSWENQQSFRDLIWQHGLIKTDLRSGEILNGLVQKAKRGRVDAAKLALELTGRYTPKGDQQPTQVAIILGGIQRPRTAELNGPAEAIEQADDV
jgi:hypothetical protein